MKKQLERLSLELTKRKEKNAYRTLNDHHHLIDFTSNDYFGIAHSKEFSEFTKNKTSQIELNGSGGSRLLSGNFEITQNLEEFIANYHLADAALIFNSGYDANVGLFSSILKKEDVVIYDEYIHASIRDGIRLGLAKSYSFKHNSVSDLERLLKKQSGNIYVAIEAVYSMDGDMAPLKTMSDLCKLYNAALIVDEAHSAGIYGTKGKGLCVEENIHNDCFARIITYGKAFGVHGAAIVGTKVLKDYLINFSRSFIYTTALPPHSILSIKAAYEYIESHYEKLKSFLESNIIYFKELSIKNNLPLGNNNNTAIQTVIIPDNSKVREVADFLQKNGFDVRPIISPTVPEGSERLRIIIHSFNTLEQIENLIKLLKLKV
jgi:8-amino-7-oxononanoate synthase